MPSNTAESFDQQLERCSINELPNEILSYIFELGTHAEEGEEHNEASVDDEWETDDEGDASMTDAYPDTEVVDVDEDEKSLGMPEHDPPPPFTVLVSHVCRKWRGAPPIGFIHVVILRRKCFRVRNRHTESLVED